MKYTAEYQMSKNSRKRDKHRLWWHPERKTCNKKNTSNTSFDDPKATVAETDLGFYYNQSGLKNIYYYLL